MSNLILDRTLSSNPVNFAVKSCQIAVKSCQIAVKSCQILSNRCLAQAVCKLQSSARFSTFRHVSVPKLVRYSSSARFGYTPRYLPPDERGHLLSLTHHAAAGWAAQLLASCSNLL